MGRFIAKLCSRYRIPLLLLLALLVPLAIGAGRGADPHVAGRILALVPTAAAPLPKADDVEGWRETCYRLLRENADLRARLFALGEPAGLRTRDEAWWQENPVRIEARVIARDASPFRGSVLVSAGSRDGVRTGAPVVVGEALVGVVSVVGERSAGVRLVTDPGQRTWAMVLAGETEDQGYVEGTGEDALDLHLIPTESAAVGLPVFTAGEDGVLPRGLLVGRITRAEDLDRDGVAEISLVPEVDASRVGFVNILVSD